MTKIDFCYGLLQSLYGLLIASYTHTVSINSSYLLKMHINNYC